MKNEKNYVGFLIIKNLLFQGSDDYYFFKSFFRENTGGITFGDFMEFLSVISKGTAHDKILWAFTFYDQDRDGVIR